MKNDYTPIYKKIKDEILNDIATGVYEPGDMIPNQNYFTEKYGVSRTTVREAINELKLRGILDTYKGKGTFVMTNEGGFYGSNRLEGLSQNRIKEGDPVCSKILSIKVIPAEKRIAKALGIQSSHKVLSLRRLRLIGEVCIAVEHSYLNYDYVKNIDFENANLETGSLYKLLQTQAGIVFKYADEEIHSVLANPEIAEYFNIECMSPILFVKRVTTTQSDIPLEYCENYERGDIYGIRIRTINL
ncbi:MAG TPA: GntR family transcriptional regulator [Clostridiales bacterium]|nr:GntR family transcriptional regulator [Clostridiales bacterium]